MKKPTPVQRFHFSRVVLFGLLASAFFIAQNASGDGIRLTYNTQKVLAYATTMSISDLISTANQSRVANGLNPLSASSTLNRSAQMKANDMTKNDYWAHESPSGVQPWYWFDSAGYSYAAAGENLAYGFSTGTDVTTAWMNSPTHKANILGDYTEVGFGISSSPSYQGGENTVIVAHYGKPQATATPPAIPSTTTPGGKVAPAIKSATITPTVQVTTHAETKNVSILEQLTSGKTSTIVIASMILLSIVSLGFILTHRAFTRHLVQTGQKFVLHHPLVDVTVVTSVLGLILTTTVGKLL